VRRDEDGVLIRGVGLRSAVAINVATMIGAGPLITIPLVVVALHGSVSVWAWIAGALIALCDGLVYAELASRLPRAGGTYAYLREAFGARGLGRLFAFLFVWQFCFWAPLTLATGYIGFAQYAGFLVPAFATNPLAQHALAIGVGALTLGALYRAIPTIARTAYALGVIAVLTLAVVALAGLTHPHTNLIGLTLHTLSPGSFGLAGFGAALIITLYDYAGYNDITQIAEEVRAPTRTIPLAIVTSVLIVAIAYIALNLGVFSVIKPDAVAHASSVASDVVDRTLGRTAANVVTLAVLVTAFASTYGLLLGASRVVFAAARAGDFIPAFAALHPRGAFPARALVALGLLALPATFLSLGDVIAALTAGIVLIQGCAQVVGLVLLRARERQAPFRVPLYPLPLIVAFSGWAFLFISSGPQAMIFGIVTLAIGALVFLLWARRIRGWPFALASLVAALAMLTPLAHVNAQTFTHAAVVERDGNPTLVVDGKPFFFWGAAFFYERVPAAQWAASMDELQQMGFNTLDLYVPWNWHETSDGVFDFNGVSNPQRNLREVLRLGAARGFHFVVRPGPVIRNEWRNGGYPAWLLSRPEYGMPLHDILEGRYPATATLQNANSDDAAAEWLRNDTHMRYAARWLTTALREFAPYADRVLAVQLDDDQGAYIDNQTWPAPHLATYLQALESTVRGVVGPQLPVFINTYEMKVTASAPVWAMGNWYQSEAYAIGEHDRAALEFSTGLLQTQTRWPVAISEFQAGWLAQPEDPQPRPADPSNTTLALHTLLGMGARGIIDFPAQDTVNPAGWEAPFANHQYVWDAALGVDLRHSNRYQPTANFGAMVTRYGAQLAQARRIADGAIAYLVSAYPQASMTNAQVFAIAARTQQAQIAARHAGITCDLVDLRFADDATLARYPFIVLPDAPDQHAFVPAVRAALARYTRHGRLLTALPHMRTPVAGGLTDATVLLAPNAVFLDLINDRNTKRTWTPATLHLQRGRTLVTPPVTLGPRSAHLFALTAMPPASARLGAERTHLFVRTSRRFGTSATLPAGAAVITTTGDDGFPVLYFTTLGNGFGASLAISEDAGARAFTFYRYALSEERRCASQNAFTSVGALRDDVLVQPPLSTTDRIGAYTRSFPAGMFNRSYASRIVQANDMHASATFTYDAPDVVPGGAHFERTITMDSEAARFVVDEHVRFDGDPNVAAQQRAVVLSSFATAGTTLIDARANDTLGFFDPATNCVATVAWRHGDMDDVTIIPERSSMVVRFVQTAGGIRRTAYGIFPA
jgi:amino acid transporter